MKGFKENIPSSSNIKPTADDGPPVTFSPSKASLSSVDSPQQVRARYATVTERLCSNIPSQPLLSKKPIAPGFKELCQKFWAVFSIKQYHFHMNKFG